MACVTGQSLQTEPGPVLVGHDRVLADTLGSIADALAQRGYEVRRAPLPGPELEAESVHDASVIVASSRTPIPETLLARATRLRGVVFPSIGIESCDLAAATRRGIVVANGATVENVQSMAEATVMLMVALRLGLPRKQCELHTHSRSQKPPPVSGRMLAGSTVGLIGFGRISREVIRRLASWRIERILVHTRLPSRVEAPRSVRFVDLETLLRESDVVSLHLPLTDETRNLLGRRQLETLKPGSVLVNTARGGLLDEVALADALAEGRLMGAAVDTFETEPPPPSHPLLACKNVILTRHNVGHTHELFDSLIPTAVENVARILAGSPPLYLCNPSVYPACAFQ